jgi:dihydrofolate reductase
MDLTIIVAISENNVIGKDGKVPWHIKGDLNRFKRFTLNHPVIMGRKTYESLPSKPLPGRKNIVLSNTLNCQKEIYLAKSFGEVMDYLNGDRAYVIGGEKIYSQFLPFSNKLEITKVFGKFEGDAFFPSIDWTEWESKYCSDSKYENGIEYVFETYERINNPKS